MLENEISCPSTSKPSYTNFIICHWRVFWRGRERGSRWRERTSVHVVGVHNQLQLLPELDQNSRPSYLVLVMTWNPSTIDTVHSEYGFWTIVSLSLLQSYYIEHNGFVSCNKNSLLDCKNMHLPFFGTVDTVQVSVCLLQSCVAQWFCDGSYEWKHFWTPFLVWKEK